MSNKESARTDGYKRGIEGKPSSSNVVSNWGDDKSERDARREGFEEGRRDRLRIDEENKGREK